jgi:hypothetical protein
MTRAQVRTGFAVKSSMKPATARGFFMVITLVFLIVMTTFVNSRFHGSFLIGLLIIVLPFLAISFGLPHLLPVRCSKCSGKMRFRFLRQTDASRQMYAYICERCAHRHEWEGASSDSSLDG